jgi:hypothetical protein
MGIKPNAHILIAQETKRVAGGEVTVSSIETLAQTK